MNKIIKNYKKWMGVKSNLNNSDVMRSFREGEVWWVSIGENIGVEIDGKSKLYTRPVVILKRHSRYCFTGIPLTSQPHEGSWWAPFEFQGRTEYAVLIQAKLMDVSRLWHKIGELPSNDYEMLRSKYVGLFEASKKMFPNAKLGWAGIPEKCYIFIVSQVKKIVKYFVWKKS